MVFGSGVTPSGVIVLQENNRGSTVETFREMIGQSGLEIVFADGDSPTLTKQSAFYYVGIMRKGEKVPAWAATQVERTLDPSLNDWVSKRSA